MPHPGAIYDCRRCGEDVMWCWGEGMRLRHQPGYWLDGDGIDRHRCDPATVQAKRLADAATRTPPAADDYVPDSEAQDEPGHRPRQPAQVAPPPSVRPARSSPRAPSGDVEV